MNRKSYLVKAKTYLAHPSKIILFLAYKGLFRWMNDKSYINTIYRLRLKKSLNLKNPCSFNEKIQWLKLYDHNPKYTKLADKYEVRSFIKQTIGEKYLVPLLGVWDRFDDIDFSKLPNKFVLKCTHDSGSVIICKDKSQLDIPQTGKKISRCLKRNYYYSSREWPYKNIVPKIIAEQYLEEKHSNSEIAGEKSPIEGTVGSLTDYKFFCFNGEPLLLYVSKGLHNHKTAQISFFSLAGDRLPFQRDDYRPLDNWEKPEGFENMARISKILAEQVCSPFVRVDLYSINGQVYFSEFTFSPCSGFMPIKPQSWDIILGKKLKIETKVRIFESDDMNEGMSNENWLV